MIIYRQVIGINFFYFPYKLSDKSYFVTLQLTTTSTTDWPQLNVSILYFYCNDIQGTKNSGHYCLDRIKAKTH